VLVLLGPSHSCCYRGPRRGPCPPWVPHSSRKGRRENGSPHGFRQVSESRLMGEGRANTKPAGEDPRFLRAFSRGAPSP